MENLRRNGVNQKDAASKYSSNSEEIDIFARSKSSSDSEEIKRAPESPIK